MDNFIGPYKIISKIASGGMADVFLATDTNTDTTVAIKVLKEEVSIKEKLLERFSQEGLLNLNHTNIVKILDAGIHENTLFIVMEYVEGTDLEQYIKQKGKLSVQTSTIIFTQILQALSYVHSKGIIHRDIKPKNILIDKNGKVFLTDFGIAKSLSSYIKTSTGGYLGAPAYSSPEQMDGADVDSRSDLYSAGVTLYEMLAGVTPFVNDSIPTLIKRKFEGNYNPVTDYRDDLPDRIISIISKCLEVDADKRYFSADEILSFLNGDSSTIIADKEKKSSGRKKGPGRKKVQPLLVSVLVALTIFGIILILYALNIKPIVSIAGKLSDAISSDTMPAQNYSIGETGPAGGFIFYINLEYQRDGWRYLEAAPNDIPGEVSNYHVPWYNGEYVETNATSIAIGKGKTNTRKIVDTQGNGNYAAKLCFDITIEGYGGWFLPSKDELDLMYKNLFTKGIGSFAPAIYWSSSEGDPYDAWSQGYGFGGQGLVDKEFDYLKVRAVRAFN